MSFYLVERYVPSMTTSQVASATARLVDLMSEEVRHLWTVLVPAEDTCLSVFEAPDAMSVEAINSRAEFPLDRIVEAEVFVQPMPASSGRSL